jgi:outer membrane protein assembly factor BamE (lipoprotein component of BamABCDE complex)
MKYYLRRLLILMVLASCGMLCSCTYFSQYENQKNAANLRVGMSKAEVIAVMGEPLREEAFNQPDVWYYYIDTKWHDTYTTQDECMPLIFKQSKLAGWGQDYYNRSYFSGKPVN